MTKITVYNDEILLSCLPPKKKDSNKGDYKRALLIAGSYDMIGSAVLCAGGAIKSGCGYVYLASVRDVALSAVSRYPEIITRTLPSKRDGSVSAKGKASVGELLKKADCVAFGCGMGFGENTRELLRLLLKECTVPLVIDADGLNCLALEDNLLKNKSCPVILTPHIGEFSRLCKMSTWEIKADAAEIARKYAEENNVVLLLKDAVSYIAGQGEKVYEVNNGSCGMAKAGSGDVLTGLLAGLVAYSLSPYEVAAAASYIHACAGTLAADKYSVNAMCATDIVNSIGEVYLKIGR